MTIISAPVKVYENYVSDHFTILNNELPFVRRDMTPRMECWMNNYDTPYTYGSGRGIRTYQAVPYHNAISMMRDKINNDFNIKLDACFINKYVSEKDHLGWHADDSQEIRDDCPIAIISFGSEREIWFRPKGASGRHTDSLLIKPNSLVLMDSGMQTTWEHRIPKHSTSSDVRISLTYRGLVR